MLPKKKVRRQRSMTARPFRVAGSRVRREVEGRRVEAYSISCANFRGVMYLFIRVNFVEGAKLYWGATLS